MVEVVVLLAVLVDDVVVCAAVSLAHWRSTAAVRATGGDAAAAVAVAATFVRAGPTLVGRKEQLAAVAVDADLGLVVVLVCGVDAALDEAHDHLVPSNLA